MRKADTGSGQDKEHKDTEGYYPVHLIRSEKREGGYARASTVSAHVSTLPRIASLS